MREVQVTSLLFPVSAIRSSAHSALGLWLRTKPVLIRHPDSGSTFPGRPVREFLILGQSVGTSILPLQSQQEMLTCTWIQIKHRIPHLSITVHILLDFQSYYIRLSLYL